LLTRELVCPTSNLHIKQLWLVGIMVNRDDIVEMEFVLWCTVLLVRIMIFEPSQPVAIEYKVSITPSIHETFTFL